MKEKTTVEIAPCGIYCGVCPAYKISCPGCCSSDKSQRRTSKWKYSIRTCALRSRQVEFCIYCNGFACTMLERFSGSHHGDKRYKYRAEILDNLRSLKKSGIHKYKKGGGIIGFALSAVVLFLFIITNAKTADMKK